MNNQKEMPEEESIEQIEHITNNEEPVKETVVEVKDAIPDEVKEEGINPKAKAKSKPRAKPNIKITKQPVDEAIHNK